MASDLTVRALDESLNDLVKWERFALYLPGINELHINTIKKNSKRDDSDDQKMALFEKWLKLCPSPTWEHVIQALEKVEENSLASKLKTKLPKKNSSDHNISVQKVQVSKVLVDKLSGLHRSFVSITEKVKSEVESAVQNGSISISRLVSRTGEEKAYCIPQLQSVRSHIDYFEAIQPFYSFLNCHLIVCLAVLLSGSIARRAKQYDRKIETFKNTTQIIKLRNTLDCFFPPSLPDSSIQVTIVLENCWGKHNLWLVEELVRTLFDLETREECQWFKVKPGSLVLAFLAPKHLAMLLIVNSVKKLHFMEQLGVTGLQVGRISVLKSKGMKCFSFENSLMRAATSNNVQVAQFLIDLMQIDVNTQFTEEDSVAINAIDEQYYHIPTYSRLYALQHSFFGLRKEVEEWIIHQDKQITQEKLVKCLQEYFPLFTELQPKMSIPSLLTVLRPHYNFLSPGMLVNIASWLGVFAQRPKLLSNEVESLKSVTQVTCLQGPLNDMFRNFQSEASIKVAVVLSNAWRLCSVSTVEKLVQKIFSLKNFDYFQWFRVVSGSLLTIFSAPKHMKAVLIKNSKENRELFEPMGVIRLTVGNVMCFSIEENAYSFKAGIEQAKKIRNSDLVQFLSMAEKNAIATVNLVGFDGNRNNLIRHEHDMTALMRACCENNLPIVKLLLENSTDPNIQTKRKFTALMYACILGSGKIVKILLSYDANINELNIQMDSPLHIACFHGNVKAVEILLTKKPNLNIENENGQTPLYIAACNGYLDIVKKLLNAKADPKVQDKHGQTAVRVAIEQSHSQIVEKLLQFQVNPPDEIDENGIASLHVATSQGYSSIVKMLLEAKANPNIQDPFGTTALYSASEKGNLQIVDFLLRANANPNIKCDNGITPLFIASWNGHLKVVEALLAAHAKPNTQDDLGRTALYIASYEGLLDIAHRLLKANANPNISKHNGATPLYVASQECHTKLVTILLEAKADPNIQVTDNGTTALHMAIIFGNLELVKLLFRCGADTKIRDKLGLSALDIAKQYKKKDIVTWLKRTLI